MAGPTPRPAWWLIATLVTAFIVYGSLYPLIFRVPAHGPGALATFIASIGERPKRGDTLVNIALYLPFGFFFGLALGLRRSAVLAFTTCLGALLSFAMEIAQYFVLWRYTSFNDVVTNALGSFLGALAATTVRPWFRLPFAGDVVARPIPSLLLLSWLAFRLYPYVPTNNLHKYWYALRPVVEASSLDWQDLVRQTAIWLVIYVLIEAIVRWRATTLLAPMFALAGFGAEVLISRIVIQPAEPVGALLALALWLALLPVPARPRAVAAGLVLCGCVIALQLEPFAFQPVAQHFAWMPFSAGAWQSAVQAFFLYGSVIYLVGYATGYRWSATLLVAVLVFGTGWAERWLPGRSASITDTVIVLIAAAILAVLPRETEAPAQRRLTAHERRLRDWQRAQARELGVEVEQPRL